MYMISLSKLTLAEGLWPNLLPENRARFLTHRMVSRTLKQPQTSTLLEERPLKAVVLKLQSLKEENMKDCKPLSDTESSEVKVKRYLNSAQPEAAPSSTMHISGSISAGSSRFWRKFTEGKTNYLFKLTKTWLKLMLSRKKLFGRGWKVNKVYAIHKKKTNVNAKESRVRKVSSERPLVEKYKAFKITDDSLLSHWWNGLTWN